MERDANGNIVATRRPPYVQEDTKHRIEELEKLNEGLGKQLDLELNEQTRQFIEDKMHANYNEKKSLKELLCKSQEEN